MQLRGGGPLQTEWAPWFTTVTSSRHTPGQLPSVKGSARPCSCVVYNRELISPEDTPSHPHNLCDSHFLTGKEVSAHRETPPGSYSACPRANPFIPHFLNIPSTRPIPCHKDLPSIFCLSNQLSPDTLKDWMLRYLSLQPLSFGHFFSVAKHLQSTGHQFCSASCSLWNKNASFPPCLYIETILQQKLWNLCPWRENEIGLDVIEGTFPTKRAPRCCCRGWMLSLVHSKGPWGWAPGSSAPAGPEDRTQGSWQRNTEMGCSLTGRLSEGKPGHTVCVLF